MGTRRSGLLIFNILWTEDFATFTSNFIVKIFANFQIDVPGFFFVKFSNFIFFGYREILSNIFWFCHEISISEPYLYAQINTGWISAGREVFDFFENFKPGSKGGQKSAANNICVKLIRSTIIFFENEGFDHFNSQLISLLKLTIFSF